MSYLDRKTLKVALFYAGICLFPLSSCEKPMVVKGEKTVQEASVSNAIIQRYIDESGNTVAYMSGPDLIVYDFKNNRRLRIKNLDSKEKFADYHGKVAMSLKGDMLAAIVRPENGNKGGKTFILIVNLLENSARKLNIDRISANSLYFSPDGSYLYFATDINDVLSDADVQVFDDGDYSYLNRMSLSDFSISSSKLIYDYISIIGFYKERLVVKARGVYPDLSREEKTGHIVDGIQFNEIVASKKYLYDGYQRPTAVEPQTNIITKAGTRNFFYQIDLAKFPDRLDKVELFTPEDLYNGNNLAQFNLAEYLNADSTSKPNLYDAFSSRIFLFSDNMEYKFIIDGAGSGVNAWCQNGGSCLNYPKTGYSYVLSRSGKYSNVQRLDGLHCTLPYGAKLDACEWVDINSATTTETLLSI